MNSKLTVAIPTFRRESALLRRVAELSPLRALVPTIVISDNDPTSSIDFQALPDHVIYRRNAANVGACANIIKLVEICPPSGHIWFRGDDDVISDQLVELVHRELATGMVDILLLTSAFTDKADGIGIDDFIANPTAIRAATWLSGLIIPAAEALQVLPCGYFGVSSNFSHVTLLLGMLEKFPQLRFRIRHLKIEKSGFRDVGREEGMKYAFFKVNFETFPDTAKVLSSQRRQRIYLDTWRRGLTLRFVGPLLRQRVGQMAKERISPKTFFAPRLPSDLENQCDRSDVHCDRSPPLFPADGGCFDLRGEKASFVARELRPGISRRQSQSSDNI